MLLSELLELFTDGAQFELSMNIRGVEFRTGTLTKQDLIMYESDISLHVYVKELFPGNPATITCYRREV